MRIFRFSTCSSLSHDDDDIEQGGMRGWGVRHPSSQGTFSFNSINFLMLFTITGHWGGAYSPPPSLHHRKRAHLCSFSMVGACLLPPPLITISTTPRYHLHHPFTIENKRASACFPPPPPLHHQKRVRLLIFDGGCSCATSATPSLLKMSASAQFRWWMLVWRLCHPFTAGNECVCSFLTVCHLQSLRPSRFPPFQHQQASALIH